MTCPAPPKYSRPAVATSFTPVEVMMRELLRTTPSMPVTVTADRVGWIMYRGDQAQCDLSFQPGRIPLEHG